MKTRVAVLFGGQSAEHEVSCVSASHVAAALDPDRYEVVPIGITKAGDWVLPHSATPGQGPFQAEGRPIAVFGPFGGPLPPDAAATSVQFDVVFPVLHGPFGEDGTIQGMLELAGCPYVGSGVLGSAVGMDKAMMKMAFSAAGLPGPRAITVHRAGWVQRRGEILDRACSLGFPSFTKPANLGSSVGISRCLDADAVAAGIDLALQFDTKALVEEGIPGREIECAVLGNDDPQASVCGEIIPGREFYDYEAKYVEPSSKTIVPADLPDEVSRLIRSYSVAAFKAVEAAGLARVDFFFDEARSGGQGKGVVINEINTMPGFTEISMFPKLWEASGIAYPELVDRLIELALQRHAGKRGDSTS
jgi:D-alanine-D-alanine ligase